METTMEELAPYMRGWRSYFGFCETPEVLVYLTRWVRLRLRAALWRQWKTPRRRRAALLALGVRSRLASNTAGSGLGPWYLARAKGPDKAVPDAKAQRNFTDSESRIMPDGAHKGSFVQAYNA